MNRISAITATAILGLCAFGWATVINIPVDYPTIQQGIDASIDGDTVLVQPGTYYENINFNGHNISLGSMFLITNDTSYISTTIIDGDSAGTVVTFESGEDSSTIITGFTIQGGAVEGPGLGGGIYCDNSSPRIIGNIIKDNLALCGWGTAAGAGIYCGRNSNPQILNNKVMRNKAMGFNMPSSALGGGIACDSSSPQIINNFIIENTAIIADYRYGGGIACRNHSNPIIGNNTIGRNEASNGAGIYINNSNPCIYGNTIIGNIGWFGGGIYINNSDSIAIINTILWRNIGVEGAEIYGQSADFELTYCDIRGGWEGEGNIDTNPMFIDPFNENYNVFSGSPCIDAGDPDILDPDSTRSDIGVFFPDHPVYSSNIWYVSITGNDITGDGTPGNPFRTIQHGIHMSAGGDTVLVQNGTYVENVYVYYKNIVLASNYIFSGDTLDIQNTIIDGDSISSAAKFEICDSSTVLYGLTITNGFNNRGGGINLLLSDPIISENIITANYTFDPSWGAGGGIFCHYSNPVIKNNIVSFNQAFANPGNGGGIYSLRSNPSIICNEISYNSVNGLGGGVYCHYSPNISINGNSMNSNSAGYGGAIACGWDTDSAVINNNKIIGNSADSYGGGLYFTRTDLYMHNNSLTGNSAPQGGGIYCGYNSSPTIVNSILWADSASSGPEISYSSGCNPTVLYSNIEGGWPGEGNIDVDPLFRNPANGDFHLMSNACGDSADSPCIDAGDPNIQDSLLDCSWGLGGLRSDMGAYGGGDSATVGIVDNPPIPGEFILMQNYPNPFNSGTTIRFSIVKSIEVKLTIYDLLGREVQTLIDGYRPAGVHTATFEVADLSSGVYFYRLQAGEAFETKRMVLLR